MVIWSCLPIDKSSFQELTTPKANLACFNFLHIRSQVMIYCVLYFVEFYCHYFSNTMNSQTFQDMTSKHFTCTICKGLLDNAVATSCGHVFCQSCLTQWLDRRECCPQCRHYIEVTSSYPIFAIKSFVNEVKQETRRQNLMGESSNCLPALSETRVDNLSSTSTTGQPSEQCTCIRPYMEPLATLEINILKTQKRILENLQRNLLMRNELQSITDSIQLYHSRMSDMMEKVHSIMDQLINSAKDESLWNCWEIYIGHVLFLRLVWESSFQHFDKRLHIIYIRFTLFHIFTLHTYIYWIY